MSWREACHKDMFTFGWILVGSWLDLRLVPFSPPLPFDFPSPPPPFSSLPPPLPQACALRVSRRSDSPLYKTRGQGPSSDGVACGRAADQAAGAGGAQCQAGADRRRAVRLEGEDWRRRARQGRRAGAGAPRKTQGGWGGTRGEEKEDAPPLIPEKEQPQGSAEKEPPLRQCAQNTGRWQRRRSGAGGRRGGGRQRKRKETAQPVAALGACALRCHAPSTGQGRTAPEGSSSAAASPCRSRARHSARLSKLPLFCVLSLSLARRVLRRFLVLLSAAPSRPVCCRALFFRRPRPAQGDGAPRRASARWGLEMPGLSLRPPTPGSRPLRPCSRATSPSPPHSRDAGAKRTAEEHDAASGRMRSVVAPRWARTVRVAAPPGGTV